MADATAVELLGRRGLRLMSPQLALVALGQALTHDETLLTVTDMDWARFSPVTPPPVPVRSSARSRRRRVPWPTPVTAPAPTATRIPVSAAGWPNCPPANAGRSC
ncbi:hypothetical protein ACFQ60_10765 [Streptomyces zhihengii]